MKQIEAGKERNVGLDALRILSMILIILLHSIDHSGVIENADIMGGIINWYTHFLYMLVQICVNCFVLLSGFFLVESKFRLHKLVTLWMEVFFYSLTIRLIYIAIGYKTFSISSVISCFVPIFTGRYWFITIYFGLYIISPFINILIHAMNKEQHLTLNIVLFVLMSGMVSVSSSFKGMNSGGGWGLAWFVTLYLVASWYRRYYQPNGKYVTRFLCWIGIGIVVALLYNVSEKFIALKSVVDNWYRYDSVPAYIMSILVFVAFLNIEIRSKMVQKVITMTTSATFGVYLIHAHADFSPWSWELLNLPQKMDSILFPFFQIAVVLGIFLICTAIDMVRKNTVGKIEKNRRLVNLCQKVQDWFLQTVTSVR